MAERPTVEKILDEIETGCFDPEWFDQDRGADMFPIYRADGAIYFRSPAAPESCFKITVEELPRSAWPSLPG